jgi:hypothetical protein
MILTRRVRFVASAVAVLSLAMLGWNTLQPLPEYSSPVTDITLWTAGAGAAEPDAGLHAALADAPTVPTDAIRVADVAGLRRAFPALQRLAIEGDGIDAADAASLQGVDVSWRRPRAIARNSFALVHVAAPRVLTVGERMLVQGRVRGGRDGDELTLSLEGPDGAKNSSVVKAAPDGDASFTITSESAAIAPGAFEWKLRLGAKGEPLVLGAVVTLPERPRVLILQSSPTVEGGRLHRWLAENGTPVMLRTRVSTEHMRFTSANDAANEIARLDATALARIDIVIAREPALTELEGNERASLEAAVRDAGLGLLIIGEGDPGPPGSFFSPWQLRPDDRTDDREANRVARLRLRDGSELAQPGTVLPVEFVAPANARWLVRDPQERTLAAAFPRGNGWVARSLVTDTWKWLQGGHPEIFASFWSHLLSSVARRATGEGRWILEHDSGPIFADHPLRLTWIGVPNAPLPLAEVRHATDRNVSPINLNLTRDVHDSARGVALLWPAQPGWHEVRILPDGAALAFHVHARESLAELRTERRRDATLRVSQGVETITRPTDRDAAAAHPRTFGIHVWFTVFLASASALWLGQRR